MPRPGPQGAIQHGEVSYPAPNSFLFPALHGLCLSLLALPALRPYVPGTLLHLWTLGPGPWLLGSSA